MARFVLIGMLLCTVSGCNLLGSDGPAEVRILIDGADGQQLRLVTTTNFLAQRQPVFSDEGIYLQDTTLVRVLDADTIVVNTPYDELYDIAIAQRFLARVLIGSPRSGLRVRAWVDGENRLDRAASADSVVQFLYYYLNSDIPLDEPTEV
ncbi:MAG: hypothetical protein JJ896_14710 [Rhodothermales bacterium]|nr:hypothetical protein [Rhodothermales bacterium]MBO6780903.1 hypothetical protein [Rhodothermales bacterium]